ncbi:polyphosphate kinase 1 [Congregibacter litoralis]|uniref:Polyphosphate kinase n=1 Tax=Congregibacter litoralis KT71 TaxID=314285 RepID=A4A3Q4_9GAMM|nr:polyphosphate kinase 1 [Congregibacter litoralis]EAQ99327.1 polyphosphate kinase 1 [Congregibacter litoralis KT71]
MSSPIKTRLADLDDSLFVPRELSWLSFNARVLQEAADEKAPEIQRLRYLGIFSNNLDEFFRVRVAEVRRLITVSSGNARQSAKDLLGAIQAEVVAQQRDFERVYATVMEALQARRIYLINERQLEPNQAQFVQDFFTKTVLPELDPILFNEGSPIPVLNDECLYLAVQINGGKKQRVAVVEVPTDRMNRFVEIPRRKGKSGRVFIALDNVIRACLPQMFRGVLAIDSAEAYCFKFSRDAELELDVGIMESLIEKMASSLKQRQKADAVRFVYDADMPTSLLDFLGSKFSLGKYDSLIPGGRYHNSKDFMAFPNVGPRYLELRPLGNVPVSRVDEAENILAAIRSKDVLLYYPYHSFDYLIDLLKTAAVDPDVDNIKICLYRVASDSRVVDALLSAVHNGKRVMAVVELAARFDEQANINWAQRLTEGGIEVKFGVPGLKVHSKLLLIQRREEGQQRFYTHIGTGNFNEKTSRLYTDFSLMTYDQDLGREVFDVFDFLQYNYRRPQYQHLLVSPHSSRPGLTEMIEGEIANARKGLRAAMTLKCNNLVDRELVMKLYEASDAGVEIRLIIRGMCSLQPGVRGISENIEAISVVDRYLEHPRVYVFYNAGKPRYYIGSADLMTRNLDYRVEVLCPIYDADAKATIQDVLDIQWHDNVRARVIDKAQSNEFVPRKAKSAAIRSQEAIHSFLSTGKKPRIPRSNMLLPAKQRKKSKKD